jgi:hypothetical protein
MRPAKLGLYKTPGIYQGDQAGLPFSFHQLSIAAIHSVANMKTILIFVLLLLTSPITSDEHTTTIPKFYEEAITTSEMEADVPVAKGWLKMSVEDLVVYRSIKDIEYALIQAFAGVGLVGNTLIMVVIGRYKSISAPHVY